MNTPPSTPTKSSIGGFRTRVTMLEQWSIEPRGWGYHSIVYREDRLREEMEAERLAKLRKRMKKE